ncbi:MAG: hypothetical protein FWC33_07075 [Candidatus Bathyarchaeota archaeon]|nr:hypothetical protein [Candidatus Termiticorpusculum sp.]
MKNEYIMGLHIGHDRGVAIIKNGVLVCALSQERIDKIKYSISAKLPFETIDAVLKYLRIPISDISFIGITYDVSEIFTYLDYIKESFQAHYGISVPIIPLGHHLAHAYSAACAFAKENSLVFVADGGGHIVKDKAEAESLFLFTKTGLMPLENRKQDIQRHKMADPFNHNYAFMSDCIKNMQISIGRKYEQFTHLLGYGFGEAGKTMGLASYGKSIFDFSKLDVLDFSFSLTYSDLLFDLYIKKSTSNVKSFLEYLEIERANIAATAQTFTEKAVLSLVKNYSKKYGIDTMCFAGGVFLNCLLNTRIKEEAGLKDTFIFPAAGDDGQAIGAACYVYNFLHNEHAKIPTLPYIGIDYSTQEIKKELQEKRLNYTYINDNNKLARIVAKLIYANKIVGIHRGRTEIGPRALCHRSLLANPANPDMKNILNKRVKHREPFRPFAPVVTEECCGNIFNTDMPSPFMLLAPTVNEKYRDLIPSVVHVDNTARVQSISKESDPFVHNLLCEISKLIGVPVLLNTSFNVNNQPIVESPSVAIDTFIRENIDALVVGNFLIVDKKSTERLHV